MGGPAEFSPGFAHFFIGALQSGILLRLPKTYRGRRFVGRLPPGAACKCRPELFASRGGQGLRDCRRLDDCERGRRIRRASGHPLAARRDNAGRGQEAGIGEGRETHPVSVACRMPLHLGGERRRCAGGREQDAIDVEPLVFPEDFGKWDSMPSEQPKRTPSTSKVTGIEPGVYMNEILVFDSRRSSYRVTSSPGRRRHRGCYAAGAAR